MKNIQQVSIDRSRDLVHADRLNLCDLRAFLGFEAESKVFDHGVGENFARNAFYLKLCPCWITSKGIVEGQLEVFSLADIRNAA
jgi:hypothetical protein